MKYCLDTGPNTGGVDTGSTTDYSLADQLPDFDLHRYFVGKTRGWGIFEDLFGKVRRQFVVDITGWTERDTLVLDEEFFFDDGERSRRVWRIHRSGRRVYTGTAGDVVGEASGRFVDRALHWAYRMELPIGNSRWRVSFSDWMIPQPDGVLISRARIRKLGFPVGSVTLVFKPGKSEVPRQGNNFG